MTKILLYARGLACLLTPVIGLTSPAIAQRTTPAAEAPMAVLDALGYGGLGFGLGVLMGAEMPGEAFGPSDAAVATIIGMTVGGIVVGARIGTGVERKLMRQQPLGTGHRAVAVAGIVLAGATLGALASVPLINPDGQGTPLGSDERTFLVLTSSGGALGGLYAASLRWDRVGDLELRMTPTTDKYRRHFLRLQLRITT